MCCVPMAMPQGHLVALCTDLGMAPSHGAAMLSVLLTSRFSAGCSGAGWRIGSAVAYRVGGSICQIARHDRLPADPQRGRTVRGGDVFGLGFSGMVPAYVLAVASCFRRPKRGGGCRRCCSAAPGWRRRLVRRPLYDRFGFYGRPSRSARFQSGQPGPPRFPCDPAARDVARPAGGRLRLGAGFTGRGQSAVALPVLGPQEVGAKLVEALAAI